MKKKISIIIGIVAVVIFGFAIAAILNSPKEKEPNIADSIHPASAETGNIAEKVIGDAKKAEVILFEYADYGCSHCAEMNKTIKELIEKYGDKLAVVFRSYNLNFKNGLTAAHAATAAQLQGYFEEYKDLLFANQAEWISAESKDVATVFSEYFKNASKGKGDINQFLSDLQNENVIKRVEFENLMGKKVGLRGTPLFRLDGEKVDGNKLAATIEAKFAEAKEAAPDTKTEE